MDNTSENGETHQNRWMIFGIGYTLFILVTGGYLNYTEPYSSEAAVFPILWPILLWTSLYIPLLVLPIFAKWEVRDFGFSLNPVLIMSALLLSVLCVGATQGTLTTWYGALSEAFARTGEEVFFRGFLFALLMKIFENKRKPHLWAIFGSALVFMLVHTQTFQESVIAQMGTGPVAFLIAQRFLNLFLGGVIFAALRHWTKSILPGSIIHSLGSGGVGALPLVLVIYALILYWAYKRKEKVVFDFEKPLWQPNK